MKTIALLLSLGLGFIVRGQSSQVKDLVAAQNYVFKAQTAIPMSGRIRNLTSDFDLKVSKNAVVSYLPYFGQAYVAPMDPSKSALEFTSKEFSYASTDGKKDGWTVTIKPKDYRDVQQLTLNISSEGYATLQVISTNRQTISFNGIIAPPAKH